MYSDKVNDLINVYCNSNLTFKIRKIYSVPLEFRVKRIDFSTLEECIKVELIPFFHPKPVLKTARQITTDNLSSALKYVYSVQNHDVFLMQLDMSNDGLLPHLPPYKKLLRLY